VASIKKSQGNGKGGRLRKDDEAKKNAAPKKPKHAKKQLKPRKKNGGASKAKEELKDSEAVSATEENQRAIGVADKRRKIVMPGGSEPISVGERKKHKRDPFEVAKRKMKGSVPAIVDAMVELAKQGSCQHAKTLLEMSGAKHMFEEEEDEGNGESWAKLVLDRLDEAESGSEQGNTCG
jgi:hypothetical protein